MHIMDSVSSPELGYFISRLFPLFEGFDPRNSISQRTRPFFGNQFRDAFRDRRPDAVAFYFCSDASIGLLLLDGAKTTEQVTGLVNGYLETQGLINLYGRNPWLVNQARNLVDSLNNLWAVQSFHNLLIAGYSAGGAVALWTAKRSITQGFVNANHVITFGSPRSFAPPDNDGLTNVDICRWMNDADPIPLVPPRAEDSPILLLPLGLTGAITYGSYIHTRGGISLNPEGQATAATLPPVAAIDPIGSLASWYSGQLGDPNNPHSIQNYSARLFALEQRQVNPAGAAAPVAPVEPVENARRRELTRSQERTVGQIAHRSSEQNKNAVAIASQRHFRAVRFGRVWSVTFGGQLFAYSGNKKRARHLARVGNELLRSLPKQAVVDPETLLQQFNDYLNAAVQPGGPSTPPINTSL